MLAGYGSDARILAGGTDLLIELGASGARMPRAVVDISRVAGLNEILESGESIIVRPGATHAQLARSGLLRRHAPLLGSAASTVGSPQIRTRGTVGGNIMNAATCADTVPPLIALGALATLRSVAGERVIKLEELFVEPYRTSARAGELLIEVRFPKPAPGARSAFIKLGRRNALSIARLSVAALLTFDDNGTILDARIVPGSAFPTWQRACEAEEMLIGATPSPALFAEAGRAVAGAMISSSGRRWSTEYKEPVIAVLVRRALESCLFAPFPGIEPPEGKTRVPSRTQTGLTQAPANEGALHATINGVARELPLVPHQTLLELLRDELGLTGTKCGCEIGECGACTVLLDGEAVNSCLVLSPQIEGREVVTVEGLAHNGELQPLQRSFIRHDAVHCGFCTPGMLMSATALLDNNPAPTETGIREAISGNLCRCTGYVQIVEAIRDARKEEHHP
jgi:xanthine dehydrogenase iron-sulfur cluster and FAD-binding subunit A